MRTLKQMMTSALLAIAVFSLQVARAGDESPVLADQEYNSTVPNMTGVLGYSATEVISSHDEIIRYMSALVDSRPDRAKLVEYGETWEGKKLVYAVISSPDNMEKLSQYQQMIIALASSRQSSELIEQYADELPATVWLAYGIHGDEISSSNAAMLTAYHLLAADQDELVAQMLDSTIIFIDPLQNPDGHDRFVHHFRTHVGLVADDYPQAAEHMQTWPGGRTNHYFFDMNRDFFAQTQPETRARVKVLQQWYPLVYVDFHEMGADSSYFFPPTAPPTNPYLTKTQQDNFSLFGMNNARWFDRYGLDYFTREVFDYFYPGYGDSWPGYYGGIGMTYEQASARGLLVRRRDGSLLTFGDGVQHHFITSLATIETASLHRQKLYGDFVAYRHSAIANGQEGTRNYVLPLQGDHSSVRKLAGLLASQGIEVFQSTRPFQACGQHGKGTYVVPLAQPTQRLIKVLLDVNIDMEDEFISEQERRRTKNLDHEMYDVTAWSLPLMFNLQAIPCGRKITADLERVTQFDVKGSIVNGNGNDDAKIAYLVAWGENSAGRLLTASLRAGLKVRSSDKPFTIGGTEFPSGSLIFKVKDNPDNLAVVLTEIAGTTGANVVVTDTSWVEKGINFGSDQVVPIKAARIGLLWDTPTSAYSAGETRFVLERQFNYPVTPIPARILPTADLSLFDSIVIPSGSYGLRKLPSDKLKQWVEQGGTLIALDNAVSHLGSDLLDVKEEYLARDKDAAKDPGSKDAKTSGKKTDAKDDGKTGKAKGTILDSADDYQDAIRSPQQAPDTVPGVILRAEVDRDHWLGAGLPDTVNVLFSGQRIYTPITLNKGRNVVRYKEADQLLASGYLWKENRKQIAYKPFLLAQQHKKGWVIGFTSSPNKRGYLDGLNLLFLNAVFRGPAHAAK
ncbi:MAG: M14 family metallopeptidase [Pseudomonadales bacterium]|jgi:hypothetical protein|nr:M14 family metallopeptidase [Pseudomonadales bacterium]MDP7357930.1 M14 family metallopeptidase [Pseudomonadales bacterium]MDP7595610.1 M14 family metallopeptidase [Pseudomonadales bacterium]HJN50348.1 M14 family metallopeptidase [Pseudomonadales bacterium]|tara:strand:- start:397 stop:3111 length:2715 start_codon:yes stop_codon:yes gene_type:complete